MGKLKLFFAALAFCLVPALVIASPASAAGGNANASAPYIVSRVIVGAAVPEHMTMGTRAAGVTSPAASAAVMPNLRGYNNCLRWKTANKTIYYRDRFHACHFIFIFAAWFDCSTNPCTLIGFVQLDQMTDFTGAANSQVMTATMRLRRGQVRGTVFLNQEFSLKLACANGKNAVCAASHGYVTHKLAEWLKPHTITYTFDTAKSKGVEHGDDGGKDGVNAHTVVEYVRFGATGHAAIVNFRCDHARYVSKGACIFSQVMMTWTISLSNKTFPQVAKHIWRAWKQPGTGTYPPGPRGKKVKIPGFASTRMPLTRLYRGYDSARYRANNARAVKACIAKWGKNYSQHNKFQCDEYPFASTYQGASSARGNPWWFSVQVLPTADNGAAGRALGRWLSENHILSSDAYWVAVVR